MASGGIAAGAIVGATGGAIAGASGLDGAMPPAGMPDWKPGETRKPGSAVAVAIPVGSPATPRMPVGRRPRATMNRPRPMGTVRRPCAGS